MNPSSRIGPDHPLRGFFSVLTEKSFYEQLGWPDHRVIRYVANLLADFADVNRVYLFDDESGQRRVRLADMLRDAEAGPSGLPEREAHRHIGDFTLFMMGLFPEHLMRLKTQVIAANADTLLDYVKIGKRSYRIVAEIPDEEGADADAVLFRKLSEHFELCVAGLGWVREGLRVHRPMSFDRFRERFLN
ncbi:MAG TPA: hypothetical protein VFN94_07235 [Nitrospiria bacterium]|nr:hypothetical protein [Nitrospiria bacterium]